VRRRLPLRLFFGELADDLEKELPGVSIVRVLDLSEEAAGALDEDKIRRAVGNLVSNARDVMGGRGVVHLTVRVVPATANQPAGGRSAANQPAGGRSAANQPAGGRSAEDGGPERLLIEVADEGPGVPAEIRATLFEPFVTARKKGGTGLGLAVARRFVEDHGGTIELVANAPSGGPTGARFRLLLPLLAESRPGGEDGAR
jgi:signal transduction histidine kinase